jgi:hypothetical protein
MSDSLTGLLVVFSEIGGFLALVVAVVAIVMIRRANKDRRMARDFVDSMRKHEQSRKLSLMESMEKANEMDHELAANVVSTMLNCEKQIYNRALKIFLGHDSDSLTQLQRDVEGMASTYRKLVDSVKSVKVVERGENPNQNAHLRMQVKQLENEKAKLEKDLAESMLSMESMLNEYTQMYSGSGAKKEGLKHIENELTQLKQKIAENLVDEVDRADLDEIPDMHPEGRSSSDKSSK